jgi:hypothetical protein
MMPWNPTTKPCIFCSTVEDTANLTTCEACGTTYCDGPLCVAYHATHHAIEARTEQLS